MRYGYNCRQQKNLTQMTHVPEQRNQNKVKTANRHETQKLLSLSIYCPHCNFQLLTFTWELKLSGRIYQAYEDLNHIWSFPKKNQILYELKVRLVHFSFEKNHCIK